jgi:hypothetical protein
MALPQCVLFVCRESVDVLLFLSLLRVTTYTERRGSRNVAEHNIKIWPGGIDAICFCHLFLFLMRSGNILNVMTTIRHYNRYD